ncbi:MAG: copper amine oxidase N-terminal domain-containing protein [Thermoanaerobacterales bacterium]|nr:copper amine oxidase N-terminal domain-containing protein [Thermoanaerobacterales bacterium]
MVKRFLVLVLAGLFILALAGPAAAAPGAPGVPASKNKEYVPPYDGIPDRDRDKDRLRDRTGQLDEDETVIDDGAGDETLQYQEQERERLGKGQGNGWGHRLLVNSKEHKFGDVPPVIKDGRVLIPVRAVTVALGGQVDWDPEARTVTVTLGDTVLKIAVDDLKATVNGAVYDLDVPAKAEQGRVVVPLRFIAQALGYEVGYDSSTGDVTVDEDEDEDEAVEEEDQEGEVEDEDQSGDEEQDQENDEGENQDQVEGEE